MNPFTQYSFEEILRTGIAVVVLFSGILAILYSIWWGFLLITSGGSEEKIKPAVNHIRHALLGLLVLIIILFVAPKVLEFFSLPYADTIRPTRIFARIQELSYSLFSRGVSTPRSDSFSEPSSSWLPSDFSDL